MAHADIVDVRHLEREMIEPGFLVCQAEEHVMVDVAIAAVAAIERADDIVLVFNVDIVGADETQCFAEPGDGLAKTRRHQHAVADALDMRRAFRQPH